MKHEVIPVMAVLVCGLCLFALPAQGKYGGGSGEPNNPYLIYTAEQMNAIGADANDWDKHFKMMADIDLSVFTGTSFNIIGSLLCGAPIICPSRAFTGVFDGNCHTISNFTYTSTHQDFVGLFGYVDDNNAEIKDLRLIDPHVDVGGPSWCVGSLVGCVVYGTITDCYVEGGSVTGIDCVGGLVGVNNYGTITNCYSTAGISGTGWIVGGLVGVNDRGTITNCSSNGSVTGIDDVGGLVGRNWEGTITNSYSTGSVSGDEDVGGLVGYNFYGTITNCYSNCSVKGVENLGGLVGLLNNGSVTASFWDIETSGLSYSDGGTGLPTAKMQTASTFALVGWWCGSVWTIDEGKDYPRLWWENAPGELITTPSYGGGSGEPDDPYLIYTAQQLNTIGLAVCDWDKHFKLMADIDMSEYTGTSFNIIGKYVGREHPDNEPFRGVFDGNGHTISNLTCNCNDRDHVGIFGYIENGRIRNLGLIDPNVDAGSGYYVGSLVGELQYGAISNCYIEGGSVSGDRYVGGLVGNNYRGTIENCYSTGNVSGDAYVGGLVGYNRDGSVSNCYSTGDVSSDRYRVGGLVGMNYGGTINKCCSSGSVSGDYCVGGLVGYNIGTIYNCYSTAGVSGNELVAGLVGYNSSGTINNCYSTGNVSGDFRVGGLIGDNKLGEVTNSFWDIETSGQTTSDGGTDLPTAEMQTISNFTNAGWDFVGEAVNGIEDIWFIPHRDYPHLWWEGMQVPMKLTPRTLNCRSQGNWVKAHLNLPQGFTVADVDPDRPAVLHSFGLESAPLYVFVNKNGLVQIETAFEREVVCSLAGNWPQALNVAGFLADGNIFLGTSTVRIIHPGMKVIEGLAWYWLNADCVQPDFCNDIDMNRDSLVNLADYALLMNINVEFVTDE